ncbi:F-box protein [Melia azedarach]|uniref:F-box protein n=1 Tax=Melia azedarach TaxID=155640 RepID=A0ACC1YVS1_MELAZ|nr:F-box protein [Melia azedarach]
MAIRLWADLPSELISLIGDRLDIIDLFSFRSVCKGWNSASSTCSAQIESSANQTPWFLLYGESSHCFLVSETDRKYKINIPEMNGATCIASKDGWLLLCRERSMFFFCPFSGSKIDLPQFPKSEQCDLVAAFSSPPTSEDCVVSVACLNELKFELHVLYRGTNTWTVHEFNHLYLNTIKGAGYVDKTFHFYDDSNKFITFTPSLSQGQKFRPHRIVSASKENQNYDILPFYLSRNSFERHSMNERLRLAEDVSVSTCGTVVPWDHLDRIFFNESISQQSEGQSQSQSQSRKQLKGVWINPRFYQVPPEMSW